MARKHSRRSRIRKAAALATVATATAAIASVPGTAHAAPFLNAAYPFTGTSHIASVNDDLPLGPGTLTARVDLATGDATADLELPPSQGEFDAIGIIPTSVTTTMIEEGQSTATIDQATGAVQATSRVTIKLSNLRVAGIPVPVGNNCKTKDPVEFRLASGEGWGILTGGPLSGTYTIGDFEHCLLATPIINLLIPGEGNTITLNLGQPTISVEQAKALKGKFGVK